LLDEEDQKAMEKSKSMWDEEFDDHQDDPKEKNISTVKFDEVEHSEHGSIDGERYEGQTTHSAWDWEDEHTNDNELDQWKSEQFKSSEPDDMNVWRQAEDQSGSQENDFAQWGFDDNSKEDKSEDAQEDNHHFSSFNDENHFDDNTSNYPSNESGMGDDHFVHDKTNHEEEGGDNSFNDHESGWGDENSFAESHLGGSDDFSYNTHDDFEEQQEAGQIDSYNGQDFGFPDVVSSEQIESTQQEDEFISQFDQDKESEEDILNESAQNQESESLNKSDSIDNDFNTQSNEEENNAQEVVEQKKKDDDLKRKNNELLPEDFEKRLIIIDDFKEFYEPDRLCHNDLVEGNFLFTKDKLYLIDFEYAGYNDYYFDIASFISENDLNYEEIITFLKAYFSDKECRYDKLDVFLQFCDLLWYTWAILLYEKRNEEVYNEIAQAKLHRLNNPRKIVY